jgi:hypothetical protein
MSKSETRQHLMQRLEKIRAERDELLALLKAERDCTWSDEEQHRAAINAVIAKVEKQL